MHSINSGRERSNLPNSISSKQLKECWRHFTRGGPNRAYLINVLAKRGFGKTLEVGYQKDKAGTVNCILELDSLFSTAHKGRDWAYCQQMIEFCRTINEVIVCD
ncbi:hypothetical protein SAMN04489726_0960 [Allokutzneria albata]|uniref:Uncharacterized protein n=1 Tax=Allokutzneria albata TaxID=211114 RepID=A0A1G9S871_ALLAB|nr:hypothetical protein SAMN04489726_0960 [Allokutzneria albata]